MKRRISVRIQVLDDDAAICRRLEGWLIEDGYAVECFTSADEAMLAVVEKTFDIALVDLRLPEHDGGEVISAILSSSPQTRVIAMAAFPKPDEAARALTAGARNLLSKPIHRTDLLAAVAQQVGEIGVSWRTEGTFNAAVGARL
ncbi:MAG: response regulator, partial [Phycisphaerae bacterium]